nr:inorganic phosphate transporter [Methanoregulaceae archaeon]
MELLIITGIVLALMLNFVNGVNDASHSIATVVETRALSPLKASISSAIANFIGPFVFTTAVAATIGTALVVPGAMTPLSLVVAMLVSIMLILVATHIGLPVSSSHALIGGILGTGVAAAGLSALILPPAGMIKSLILFSLIGAGIGALILGILAYYLKEGIRPALVLGVIFGISVTIPLMILADLLVLSGILAIIVFIFISPVIGFIAAF